MVDDDIAADLDDPHEKHLHSDDISQYQDCANVFHVGSSASTPLHENFIRPSLMKMNPAQVRTKINKFRI